MPDVAERNAAVHDLLSDARIARAASDIARENGDQSEMHRLRQKSRDLRKDAHTVDPRHECAAWANDANGTL
jgi:hypothetical protein